MRNAEVFAIAAGLGFLAWALSRDSATYQDGEIPMGALPSSESDPYGDDGSTWSDSDSGWLMVDLFSASEEQRLYAFLYMLRHLEHTTADAASGEAYRTFYGGSRFIDQSDHPVITGEKVGVKLSDAMCKNAGLGPGCVSTAAGAYQIIKPTWQTYRSGGNWGPRLADFSNASQDEAARRILWKEGILSMIYVGDIEKAIYKASKTWASLPGNQYRQGAKTISVALARYQDGLNEAAEFLG